MRCSFVLCPSAVLRMSRLYVETLQQAALNSSGYFEVRVLHLAQIKDVGGWGSDIHPENRCGIRSCNQPGNVAALRRPSDACL